MECSSEPATLSSFVPFKSDPPIVGRAFAIGGDLIRIGQHTIRLDGIEAPESLEELRRIPREVPHPLLVNMLTGGVTPILTVSELEKMGYTATKHQREVGTGYFDEVSTVLTKGTSSTLALKGSTEEAQFEKSP